MAFQLPTLILFKFLISDECYFIIVHVFVILVNKYVLSVLKFTIPTVYQGWQTLICVLILTGLTRWKKLKLEVEIYDKKILLTLVIPMMCYTLSIISGSKALAELPVPVFLAGSNLTPAMLILLETVNSSHTANNSRLTTSFLILFSLAALFVMGQSSSPKLAWGWLMVHVVTGGIHTITVAALHLPRLNANTLIYHRNFFSILILIPLSITLEEAAHAYQYHNRLASINFYLGCVLSGLLGTWLQFLSGRIENSVKFPLYLGYSRLLAAVASWCFFIHSGNSNLQLSVLEWGLIIVNLVAATFGFKSADSHTSDSVQDKNIIDI